MKVNHGLEKKSVTMCVDVTMFFRTVKYRHTSSHRHASCSIHERRFQNFMKKNVQIPFPIFRKLLLFHLRHREEFAGEITEYLNTKLESMVKHDLYTIYKCDTDEERKEKARIKYLDMQGVPESFRY